METQNFLQFLQRIHHYLPARPLTITGIVIVKKDIDRLECRQGFWRDCKCWPWLTGFAGSYSVIGLPYRQKGLSGQLYAT